VSSDCWGLPMTGRMEGIREASYTGTGFDFWGCMIPSTGG